MEIGRQMEGCNINFHRANRLFADHWPILRYIRVIWQRIDRWAPKGHVKRTSLAFYEDSRSSIFAFLEPLAEMEYTCNVPEELKERYVSCWTKKKRCTHNASVIEQLA